ncbi:MAG: hypothetical protein V4538_02335 [Bacteroidota bacterium]
MKGQINIQVTINNDEDLSQLVGLYSGVLGGVNIQAPKITVLNELKNKLEAELERIYSPEQWQAMKAQIVEHSQKAATVAEDNKGIFDDMKY